MIIFFLFIILQIFSENLVKGELTINSDLKTEGSIFVKDNFKINEKLSFEKMKIIGGKISVVGDVFFKKNLYADKFTSLGNKFDIKKFSTKELTINLPNFQFGIGEKYDKNINIGNYNANKGIFEINSLNIDIGNKTLEIKIGSNKSKIVKINSLKNGDSEFFLSGKSLKLTFSDFSYPESGSYKLLSINNLGRSYVNDYANSDLSSNSIEIDNLKVNKKSIFNGNFVIDDNATKVEIGSGSGNIILGNQDLLDTNKTSIELIGQLDLIGNNISIGDTQKNTVFIGDKNKENIVKITNFGTENGFILNQNDDIVYPAENEIAFLKIGSDKKLIVALSNDANDITIEDVVVNGTSSTEDRLLSDGEIGLSLGSESISEIGNIINGGNIFVEASDEISIFSNNSKMFKSVIDPTVAFEAKNLKLKIFSFLEVPDDGKFCLTIDSDGFIKNIDSSSLDSIILDDLTSGNFNCNNTNFTLNAKENLETNIGTGEYSGNISIGNNNVNQLLIDSNGTIDGYEQKIKIGAESNKIYFGGLSCDEISIITKEDSGNIKLSGKTLNISMENDSNKFLIIDKDGKLGITSGNYYLVNENDKNELFLSEINGKNVFFDGKINIGDNKSIVNIGKISSIGDNNSSFLFNGVINCVFKNIDFRGKTIKVGKKDTSEIVFLSDKENNIFLNIEDISLPTESNLFKLMINKDGKIISTIGIFTDINGNVKANSTNQEFDIKIGNSLAKLIDINSESSISIKAKKDIKLIANTENGKIFLYGNNISLLLGNSNLYVSKSGVLTTENILTRKIKKNVKKLDTSIFRINKLKPKKFFYVDSEKFGKNYDFGLLAEDLLKIGFESSVIKDESNNPISINYDMVLSVIAENYKNFIDDLSIINNKVFSLKERCNELILHKIK